MGRGPFGQKPKVQRIFVTWVCTEVTASLCGHCAIKHGRHAQVLGLILMAVTDEEKELKVRRIYETCGMYLGYCLSR